MTTRFSLTLPDELKNEIAERAKQNRRSMTQEIVSVLSQPVYDLKIGRLEVKPGDVLVVKSKYLVGGSGCSGLSSGKSSGRC